MVEVEAEVLHLDKVLTAAVEAVVLEVLEEILSHILVVQVVEE
jgi:hypothetical protein